MMNKISGPIDLEQFKKLAVLPYGEALKVLQVHDPLYGKTSGEKIKWKVTMEASVPVHGTGFVMASSREEAEHLADKMSVYEIHWGEPADPDDRDMTHYDVEPV